MGLPVVVPAFYGASKPVARGISVVVSRLVAIGGLVGHGAHEAREWGQVSHFNKLADFSNSHTLGRMFGRSHHQKTFTDFPKPEQKTLPVFVRFKKPLRHRPHVPSGGKPHRDTGNATLAAWPIEGREQELRQAIY